MPPRASTPRTPAWLAALGLLAACKRTPPTPRPEPRPIEIVLDVPEARADASADAPRDAPAADAAPPAVLTVRLVNGSSVPIGIYINPDVNEMLHVRRLWARRNPDASTDGELVKFFPVGQMALCESDGGAGYGGIGQPERRTLQPGEALEYAWDGRIRREVLQRERGVCQEIRAAEPGRYRFEVDQPYGSTWCPRVTVALPLGATSARVIELRCMPRAPRREGASGDAAAAGGNAP